MEPRFFLVYIKKPSPAVIFLSDSSTLLEASFAWHKTTSPCTNMLSLKLIFLSISKDKKIHKITVIHCHVVSLKFLICFSMIIFAFVSSVVSGPCSPNLKFIHSIGSDTLQQAKLKFLQGNADPSILYFYGMSRIFIAFMLL